ncbi:site-specific integrase, partial [Luminiphilus sp.]|nr:site-specific integrase [Luminiphilus sp.]
LLHSNATGTVEVTVVATLVKVGTKTKALIRKQGYPTRSKTFVKHLDAQVWAKKVESEMERGCFDDSARLKQFHYSEALEAYLESCRRRKLRATKFIEAHSRILQRHLGDLRLSDITHQVLAAYRDERLHSVAAATVKHELGIAHRALKHQFRTLGVPVERIPTVRHPTISNARERRVRPEELEALLTQIPNAEMRVTVQLAVETGMRRGELVNMHWHHIDWDRRTLLVPVTKTNRKREVPLSTAALALLKSLIPDGGQEGRILQYQPDSITQAFARAALKAGLSDIRLHDLRHEATTRFFEKGLSMMEVAAITGHQDPRMLRRYTHLDAADLADRLG